MLSKNILYMYLHAYVILSLTQVVSGPTVDPQLEHREVAGSGRAA